MSWMWKSGAWIAVLVDSKVLSKGKHFGPERACEYADRLTQPQFQALFADMASTIPREMTTWSLRSV